MYVYLLQHSVKNLPANAGDIKDAGSIPGSGRPLEEGMATHSSILAWRIPWTGEPGGLQPKGHKESDTTEGTYAQSFPLVQKVTQETCRTPHISLSRK